jgi:hypothetical protein
VLATIEPLVVRRLHRRGLADDAAGGESGDGWADEAPVLAGLAAASVEGVAAVGPRRGTRPVRLGTPREPVESPVAGRCHGRVNGFDLDAGRAGGARGAPGMARARVPLHAAAAGGGRALGDDRRRPPAVSLKQPWRDGTTALSMRSGLTCEGQCSYDARETRSLVH